MTKHNKIQLFTTCACAIALGASMPSFGQDTPSEEDSSALDAITDVLTVTARRREETAQSTPVSLTALSGEGLEARGITDISEIESLTPNLTYQNSPGAGGASNVATVYLRGVGQRDFLGTIDNAVGFYIDDVYYGRALGGVVELLDVERVEVLRGPQGTLFGRNNVGGAIKLHSRTPGDVAGGYVDATYGTDNLYAIKASIDTPLGDNLLTNFSALASGQDGYVDRPAGGDLGNKNVLAARYALEWDATESLSVSLAADISDSRDNGPAFTLAEAGTLADGGFPGFHNNVLYPDVCAYPGGITSTDPQCYNAQWESDSVNNGTAPTYSDIIQTGVRLGVDWSVAEDITLKSITSFRKMDAEFARDADTSPLTVLHFYDDFETETFSQEFQLLGEALDGKLNWTTGLYYYDELGENINLLEFAIANFISGSKFGTDSKAVFAQATYDVTDTLSITGGLRYTQEEKSFTPDQVVGTNNIDIPEGTLILPAGKNSRTDEKTTPTLTVSYTPLDGLMVYSTYAEGFRSGGYVQRIFPPLSIVPNFGPETAKSYEAGLKFDNGGFRLNTAAFLVDYTDIQVRTQNPGYVGFFEANVGNAQISGFEVESHARLFDGFFVEGALGYTDAEYTSIDVEAPLVASITTESEFPHVPEWSASASLLKEFDLDTLGDVVARLSVDYHDGYFNNPENTTPIVTPERTLVDLSFVWTDLSGDLSVDFGVKNLTDERYVTAGYNNPSIGTAEVIIDRGIQWYIGSRLSF